MEMAGIENSYIKAILNDLNIKYTNKYTYSSKFLTQNSQRSMESAAKQIYYNMHLNLFFSVGRLSAIMSVIATNVSLLTNSSPVS